MFFMFLYIYSGLMTNFYSKILKIFVDTEGEEYLRMTLAITIYYVYIPLRNNKTFAVLQAEEPT